MADKTQSGLSAAALRNVAATNKLLEQQVILTNAINQVLKDNIDQIGSSGNKIREQLKTAGVDVDKTWTGLQKNIASSAGKSNVIIDSQLANMSGLEAMMAELKTRYGDITQGGKQTVLGVKDVMNKVHKILKDMGKEYVGMMSRIQAGVGGNAIGVINTTNKMATRMVSLATESLDDYYSGVIPELDASFRSIFRTPTEYFSYMEAISTAGTVAHQMLQDLTNEQIKQSALLGKAMDLNAVETQAILERTFARNGETSIKMLENMAHYSKSMEKHTGIAAKVIAEQMAGLITDSKNFANITEQQAAKASASLVKLGLDYKDLGGMVEKFQGFESAASSVADLTTAFGVQIDVMKMMDLANENQGEGMLYLRKQFLSAGVDVRTLSAPYKRLLAQLTGMKSVGAVEKLFNPEITDDVAALEAATAEGSEGAAKALEGLSGDIERVISQGDDLVAVVGERIASAVAVKLAPAAGKASIALSQMVDDIPVKALDALGNSIDKLAGLSKADFSGVETSISTIGGMMNNLVTAFKTADLEKNIKPFMDAMEKLVDPLTKAFVKGFEALRPELKLIFEGMATDIKDAWKSMEGSSPSEFTQTHIIDPFRAAAKIANKDINDAFNPGRLDSIQELRELIPDMIKKGLVTSEKDIKAFNKFIKMSDRKLIRGSSEYRIDQKEIKARNKLLTDGFAEAIQGGGKAVESYIGEHGDKLKNLYFKDIKSSEDVLSNYSQIAQLLKPLKSQLAESGYDFDNLTAKTQKALKPLMQIEGINLMDLMKMDSKHISKLEGMNKQFENLKDIQAHIKATGSSTEAFFSGEEGERRLNAVVKQGQFASKAAAMAALSSGDCA